jgi:DNA mismatch endonuclease (patch repair protein)
MDFVDKSVRSRMMAAVRSKNTKSEIEIRRRLFRLGFRYRLHGRDMPGKPDLIFPRYRAVVFINGCFWHNHDCQFGALPLTRRNWWRSKLEGNRKRDEKVLSILHEEGWRTLIVWECSFRKATRNRESVLNDIAGKISRFLCSRQGKAVISSYRIRVKMRPA